MNIRPYYEENISALFKTSNMSDKYVNITCKMLGAMDTVLCTVLAKIASSKVFASIY